MINVTVRRKEGFACRPDRLGGCAASSGGEGCRARRHSAVRAGPNDAEEQTDVESFAVLEPTADGFRDYLKPERSCRLRPCWLSGRTSVAVRPEMTVLVGGMALDANAGGSPRGVLPVGPRR